MALNPRWERWISASVALFFSDNSTVETYIEGAPRDTQAKADFVEWRLNGLNWKQRSKDEFYGTCDLNIFVSHSVGDDVWTIKDMMGQVQANMSVPSIAVYKYGPNLVLDDNSFLGCLQRTNDPVVTQYFGLLAPDVNRERGILAAKYFILLDGDA